MDEQTKQFFTKKNIISFLVIGILLLSIPFGVRLALEQTQLRSRAAGTEITFVTGDTVACTTTNGKETCTTTSDTVPVELRSPFGPPGAAIVPTATPGLLGLNSDLVITAPSGATINSDRSYTVSMGTPLTFTVNAKSTGKALTKGWLEVIKTDKSAPPCGGGAGGAFRPDNLWCVLNNTVLSGFSGTFTGTWTPTAVGEYYVISNLFNSPDPTYTSGTGCTSTPWCVFGTGNCKENMWTYGSCGQEGYIKVVVTSSGLTGLSSNLSITTANYTVNSDRSFTIGRGTPLTFTVNAKSTGKALTQGWLEVIKTDKSAAPCGGAVGGNFRPDNLWCILSNTALSGFSGTFTGTWTPTAVGEYYVISDLFNSPDPSYSSGTGCTSTPWCVFGTGNCKENMWTYGSCGKEGYIKLNVVECSGAPRC